MNRMQAISDEGYLLCMCCREEVEHNTEPVQVSGWYGGKLFQWRSGRCDMDLWFCTDHKREYLKLDAEYHQRGFYETDPHPINVMRQRYKDFNHE